MELLDLLLKLPGTDLRLPSAVLPYDRNITAQLHKLPPCPELTWETVGEPKPSWLGPRRKGCIPQTAQAAAETQ